jgi:hypothetical protein
MGRRPVEAHGLMQVEEGGGGFSTGQVIQPCSSSAFRSVSVETGSYRSWLIALVTLHANSGCCVVIKLTRKDTLRVELKCTQRI